MTCPVCGATANATKSVDLEGCPQCGADLRVHTLLRTARDRSVKIGQQAVDEETETMELKPDINPMNATPGVLPSARQLLWIAGAQVVASLALLLTAIALAVALYNMPRVSLTTSAGPTPPLAADTMALVARDIAEVNREALRLYSSEREERLALTRELAAVRSSTATATLPPVALPAAH